MLIDGCPVTEAVGKCVEWCEVKIVRYTLGNFMNTEIWLMIIMTCHSMSIV